MKYMFVLALVCRDTTIDRIGHPIHPVTSILLS